MHEFIGTRTLNNKYNRKYIISDNYNKELPHAKQKCYPTKRNVLFHHSEFRVLQLS